MWGDVLSSDQDCVGSFCLLLVTGNSFLETLELGNIQADLRIEALGISGHFYILTTPQRMRFNDCNQSHSTWHASSRAGCLGCLCFLLVLPQFNTHYQADNLDMFNNNFPYRRTGKGLRVIFPEARGNIFVCTAFPDFNPSCI